LPHPSSRVVDRDIGGVDNLGSNSPMHQDMSGLMR
jgi:hypothetical protein